MRVLFKKTAIDDILQTEKYLRDRLHNPQAAKRITRMIYTGATGLGEHPYKGPELRGRFELDSDLRFLVVEKQMIFYRVLEDRVEILRVLDGRQDYLSVLF